MDAEIINEKEGNGRSENLVRTKQELARTILAESCLQRRRVNAACYLNSSKSVFSILVFSVIIISVYFVISILIFKSAKPLSSTVSPIPLTEPTRAHRLDRFHYIHTVRKGDSLWKISDNYYGNSYGIERLRENNSWLPKEARKLDEGKTIIISINNE